MKEPVLAGEELDELVSSINKRYHSSTQQSSNKRSDWLVRNQKLNKTFVFKGFIDAFAFMTQVALIAEKMNHHPEWRNVYNKVEVDLVTHDSNGITKLDIALATKMEQLIADQ